MAELVVHVPDELAAQVGSLLQARGVSVEEAVAIYLRSLLRINRALKVYDLGDKLLFGKYRGELLESVIRVDPRYMRFMVTVAERPLMISEAAGKLLEEAETVVSASMPDEEEKALTMRGIAC